jgi:serine protease AprX
MNDGVSHVSTTGDHDNGAMTEGPDDHPDPSPERPDVPSEFGMPPEESTRQAGPGPDPGRPAAEGTPQPANPVAVPTSPDLVADSMISRPLAERMARATRLERIGVVIELSARHPKGVEGASIDVARRLRDVAPGAPVRRARGYVMTALSIEEIRKLVQIEQDQGARSPTEPTASTRAPRWAIHRMWPNFETHALIHRSIVTTKCDAAQRSFNALGADLVWAVLDSGIDSKHAHFQRHDNLGLKGDALPHRSFVPETKDADALRDLAGHGTHVAGILAGEQVADGKSELVAATWYHDDRGDSAVRPISLARISGMAPRCRLLSCKVLRDDGSGDLAALLEALEYIQDLNRGGRELEVHGVNLSVGYPFDPSWFATGLTPVCREVDRLVRSGVLVVVAAGNTGYGYALDPEEQQFRLGFDMTINDPGNAERALTVGSTSTMPHATGVSYFSSKGPTGDGRMKPDLVAPGERVVSAGAGTLLANAQALVPTATYVENSGTSMAAPHVSGAAAAFLSVHREFVGRPEDVKRVLIAAATDLGRSPTFQGGGLVDVMRAIQSV